MRQFLTLSACLVCVGMPATAGETIHDWNEFYACAEEHSRVVEDVEPSLFDGARLIVDVLCIGEAARLANKIASRPQLREQRAFADAFETGLHV